jgi:hypothetical protein
MVGLYSFANMNSSQFSVTCSPPPAVEGVRRTGEGENMSNTLRYLRGELKDSGKMKPVSFGKRVLEIGFRQKMLLAVYNKITK